MKLSSPPHNRPEISHTSPEPKIPKLDQNLRFCSHVKTRWAERDLVVFVDNCYGEFVEDKEPCHVGADLIAGSLIKNPGGTVAKSGERIDDGEFRMRVANGSSCRCCCMLFVACFSRCSPPLFAPGRETLAPRKRLRPLFDSERALYVLRTL